MKFFPLETETEYLMIPAVSYVSDLYQPMKLRENVLVFHFDRYLCFFSKLFCYAAS